MECLWTIITRMRAVVPLPEGSGVLSLLGSPSTVLCKLPPTQPSLSCLLPDPPRHLTPGLHQSSHLLRAADPPASQRVEEVTFCEKPSSNQTWQQYKLVTHWPKAQAGGELG